MMTYIYCVKVAPQTQDDVNAKFREQGLRGELVASQASEFYICPQLSHKKWAAFPQALRNDGQIDSRWDKAIEETVAYLVQTYAMPEPAESPAWVAFEASYRCPRMESYLREQDLKSEENADLA